MKPARIADGVFNVGVNDWDISDFHGYSTPLGTSYNAFLVVDEKVALIDTVKREFGDQMMANIAEIIDPAKIDYVISNHTELDHSGALPALMQRVGPDKPVYCSRMGAKHLPLHFHGGFSCRPLQEGEEISLGKRKLRFVETRMVHWPDSMFSYLEPDGILFSSDGFGQHYAGFERFDDVLGDAVMSHAKKYFANIMLLYAPLVLRVVEKVAGMGPEIRMICPDHGIIWRKDPLKIVEAYRQWCHHTPRRKAVVVYDTMWHSTEKMADAVSHGLSAEGVEVRLMYLRKWHRSDVMTEVLDAKAVVVGSPTLNNGLFPTVAEFLSYMRGLKPLRKIGGAFGSHGWSGEAAKLIAAELRGMQFDVRDPLTAQFVPDDQALSSAFAFGQEIGKAINQQVEE